MANPYNPTFSLLQPIYTTSHAIKEIIPGNTELYYGNYVSGNIQVLLNNISNIKTYCDTISGKIYVDISEVSTHVSEEYVPLSGNSMISGNLSSNTFISMAAIPLTANTKTVATTEWVKSLNYLPVSGGTITGTLNTQTPDIADNSTKAATTEWVNSKLNPIGTVIAFAGDEAPDGYLLCDGRPLIRTEYSALYAVIGDKFGAGDGVNTFNLPNLIDRFVQGSTTAGTVKEAGLPNISGTFSGYTANNTTNCTGAFTSDDAVVGGPTGTDNTNEGKNTTTFEASASNPIYGNSTTVQPPAVTLLYCIKY